MQINTSRCDHLEVVSHNCSFPSFCVIYSPLLWSPDCFLWELVQRPGVWLLGPHSQGELVPFDVLRGLQPPHTPPQEKANTGRLSFPCVQRDAVPVVGGHFTTLQHSGDDLLSFAFCGGVC